LANVFPSRFAIRPIEFYKVGHLESWRVWHMIKVITIKFSI
jgi:hypothetical protein